MPPDSLPPGYITTIAGTGDAGFTGDGGPATAARLNEPVGIATDSAGNLYIADAANGRIRKISPDGIINSIILPAAGGFVLTNPNGLAVDTEGNIYVADFDEGIVLRVTPDNVPAVVAGGGAVTIGDHGPATSAQLASPYAVAVDTTGNFYISDGGVFAIPAPPAAGMYYHVHKVSPDGLISIFAGGMGENLGDGGPATEARLDYPLGVAVDSQGNLYIADAVSNRIRRVGSDGIIETIAGVGTEGFSGDNGPAVSAQLFFPSGIAFDGAGNLFIADYGNFRIRKVTPDGTIFTVAGNGTRGYGEDSVSATSTRLHSPSALTIDREGNLIISERWVHRVRKVVGVAAGPNQSYIPHIATGQGWSTEFLFTNTGNSSTKAQLSLVDPLGNPLGVRGRLYNSENTAPTILDTDSFELTVPTGGTVFLSITSPTELQTGWARLVGPGETLTSFVTYENEDSNGMHCRVGAFPSQLVESATIPIDVSNGEGKRMAYAIANPSEQPLDLRLSLIGQDGSVVRDDLTITLGPWQQTSRYLLQEIPLESFRGTLVFSTETGTGFAVVALTEKKGLFTAAPVIPRKAPVLPN